MWQSLYFNQLFYNQVETGSADILMYREAYTYVNITKSDLQPILITGSVAKVTRGWGQMLILNPMELSLDPDNPNDKVTDSSLTLGFAAERLYRYWNDQNYH